MVRVLVGSDEAERYGIVRRPLQLAAGEHAGGVTIDQDAQKHSRVIQRLTESPVAAKHRPQIRPAITSTTKRARCFSGVAVNRTKVLHAKRPEERRKRISVPRFYHRPIRDVKSDRLLAPESLGRIHMI